MWSLADGNYVYFMKDKMIIKAWTSFGSFSISSEIRLIKGVISWEVVKLREGCSDDGKGSSLVLCERVKNEKMVRLIPNGP